MRIVSKSDIFNLLPKKFINRTLEEKIIDEFDKDRVTVLYGPRQVGKSSLVLHGLYSYLEKNKNWGRDVFYFSLDRKHPEFSDPETFIASIKAQKTNENTTIVIIDEAQRLENVGVFIKYLYDQKLDVKYFLTGSASLEINAKIKEPLTGRKREYFLAPLTVMELLQERGYEPSKVTTNVPELKQVLEEYLLYGGYPEVITSVYKEDKQEVLEEIVESYVVKDLSALFNISNEQALRLTAVYFADRIGNLLSKETITKQSGIKKTEIDKCVRALEQTFVTWQAYPFSSNRFREIIHQPKIYFFDLGLRNALLKKLDSELIFPDKGALLENAVGLHLAEHYQFRNVKFWQNQNQTEVDFVCEKQGAKVDAFEVKFHWDRPTLPRNMKSFANNYKEKVDKKQVITLDSFWKLFHL